MRILQLQAQNIKRLKAVSITPQGDVVTIAGENGAGKTSLLDAISYVFVGAGAIATKPIRDGQEEAHVRLDLGDIIVRREFSGTRSTLYVEARDGARYGSPQKFVDALYGELTFDPLAFSRMAPKEQRETLRKLVPLDVDVDEIDRQHQRDYVLRTEWNRKVSSLSERAKFLEGAIDPAADVTLINVDALVDQIAMASEHNAAITLAHGARTRRDDAIKALYQDAANLVTRAAALRKQADDMDEQSKRITAKADEAMGNLMNEAPIADPIDVSELRTAIDRGRATNAERSKQQDARETHQRVVDELQSAMLTVESLERNMAARQETKTMAIARAKMPVAGLAFGPSGVLYNDIPFEQASHAEQLRVSFAIAMAKNPKLKVVLIRDGSLLTAKSLAIIAEMAAEHGYQVWIERAEAGAKVGILIEEGEVAAIDGVPVERELVTQPEG